MAWRYHRLSGQLFAPNGDPVAAGYSGRDAGYNNPALEAVADVGPIPAGSWRIGPAFVHALAGPVCMRLAPASGLPPHKRDGFMIHGDSAAHAADPQPDNSVSHGCVILPREVRERIAASADRMLEVT